MICPNCGSENMQQIGFGKWKGYWFCSSCSHPCSPNEANNYHEFAKDLNEKLKKLIR